jgi:hypothetical protein
MNSAVATRNLLEREGTLQKRTRNIASFLRRRLYQDFGTKELIERFYKSIRSNSLAAIPYREIILTARITDEIFAQIYAEERPQDGKQVTNDSTQRKATISLVPCH